MQHSLRSELMWIVAVSVLAALGSILGTANSVYFAGITGLEGHRKPLWAYLLYAVPLGYFCNLFCAWPFISSVFIFMELIDVSFVNLRNEVKLKLLYIELSSIASSIVMASAVLAILIDNNGENFEGIFYNGMFIAGIIPLTVGGFIGYSHYKKYNHSENT